MTLVVELDDGTPVEVVGNVREALSAHSGTNRVVLRLTRGDAELLVGFRGERGACYWRQRDGGDLVSSGGHNAETELYGASEIPFPPGAEIDAAAVLDAAEEFARTGARPTCVAWTSYHDAMPAAESAITPDALLALLDEPDTDR